MRVTFFFLTSRIIIFWQIWLWHIYFIRFLEEQFIPRAFMLMLSPLLWVDLISKHSHAFHSHAFPCIPLLGKQELETWVDLSTMWTHICLEGPVPRTSLRESYQVSLIFISTFNVHTALLQYTYSFTVYFGNHNYSILFIKCSETIRRVGVLFIQGSLKLLTPIISL